MRALYNLNDNNNHSFYAQYLLILTLMNLKEDRFSFTDYFLNSSDNVIDIKFSLKNEEII